MIEIVAETGSTNADLAARLAGGERVAEGHWLVADRQHAGRGRQGRAWCDGSGNFMGSTVAYPGGAATPASTPPASTLALSAGLAVYETLLPLLAPARAPALKWPNDVLVGNAKLAGILLERVGDAVVVGIGVNLARAPDLPDRETAALAKLGPAPDRDAFAASLAASFARELERWRIFGLAPIVRRWTAAGLPEGTPMTVHGSADARIAGRFAGLNPDGSLRLCLDDGTTRAIYAGDVVLG